MSVTDALSKGNGTEDGGDSLSTSRAEIDDSLRRILKETLHIHPSVVSGLTGDSGLFGSLPEIDSMAVANLFTAIEDRFGFTVEDEDVDGEMLETYDGLVSFVERKVVGI